jgi:opacity protein-like surface antigen
MLRQRRNFDHYEYIDFNYRKQKIDFFARLGYNRTKYQQNQKTEESLYLDKTYTTRENFQIKSDRNSWDATAGLNYSFSPVHSMGIRYKYSSNPKYKWESIGNTLH